MTDAEQLAGFVTNTDYDALSQPARRQLKLRVLDAFGCAIGAMGNTMMLAIRDQIDAFGGAPLCTLIGGGRTAPDRAVLYNSALVGYLDFNDSYLAKKETCHPSDNLGAILAAGEYADSNGREFSTALAVAYQIQCRLSDVAPVRDKGFDHTTQGSYAVAAGVSKSSTTRPDANSECSLHIGNFLPQVQEASVNGLAALVDVRSPEEFTGEILAPPGLPETCQRGGHVPGAQNVPGSKAFNDDGTFKSAAELRVVYGTESIDGSKPIIAYCRIGERSSHTLVRS